MGTIRTIFTIVDIPNIETITSKTMAEKNVENEKIWSLFRLFLIEKACFLTKANLIGFSRVVLVRLG